MKPDTITLIACGSVTAAIVVILFVCYLLGAANKKKQTIRPSRDVERGHQGNGTKNGGMVILTGTGAALTAAVVVASLTIDGHGSGGGGGGDDSGGGACGGNDGGACGGCGGDCGAD